MHDLSAYTGIPTLLNSQEGKAVKQPGLHITRGTYRAQRFQNGMVNRDTPLREERREKREERDEGEREREEKERDRER